MLNVIGAATLFDVFGEAVTPPSKRAVDLSTLVRRKALTWAHRYGLSLALTDVLARAALGHSKDAIAAARGSSRQTVKKQACTLLRRTGDKSLDQAGARLLREIVRT